MLPILELIEQSRMAIDEMIDVMGRASIEAVLRLSAYRWPGHRSKARHANPTSSGTELSLAGCV